MDGVARRRKEAVVIRTALVALVAVVAPAIAQVRVIAPYYAVVQSEKAGLHCSDSDRFYKVAETTAGTVLMVDAEGGGWSRVNYPAGVGAFVRAMDGSLAGEDLTLTQPSRLRAANAAQGYDGSYKALFETPLPAGTVLKVQEAIKDVSGATAGYKVAAPNGAKAFAATRNLRRATDAEVTAFKAKAGSFLPELPAAPIATTPAPVVPAPVVPTPTPSNPEVIAKTPDGTRPAPGEPATLTPTTPETQPVVTPPTPVVAPVAAAPERTVGTWDALDQSFQAMWKQPILAAEVDELIAEFDRAIEAVPADKIGTKRQLEARREALTLRREFRDTLRRQEDDRAAADKSRQAVSTQLEEIARTRYYTIVGQLQPSLVYDGKGLPRMYRVVSVGASASRTLGYLRPTDSVRLDDLVGQVVGVIGEAQLDRSLQLNIITPVHVDLLKSVPTPAATPDTSESK